MLKTGSGTAELRWPDTGYDLWLLSLHGDHTPRLLLQTKVNEHVASLTPDGQYTACVSDVTGRDEIWVRRFPECDGATMISADGGTGPLWDPSDGRTLFYRDVAATRDFAVPVTRNPSLAFGTSITINGWWRADMLWARNYDITPDGKRLVMIGGTSTAGNEITVVQNWFEELKQKLGERRK